MSQSADLPDDAADILAEFLDALDQTDDVDALVASFAARRPDLAPHFREEVKFNRLLQKEPSRPQPVGDLEGLPDFRIVRWIATGGMGVVYEAEQISLGRRVALKIRYGTPSPERLERFLREQRTLARLHQSHIVPIHVSGQSQGRHYFAMSFIDGFTLQCLVREARRRLHENAETRLPTLPELVRQLRERSQSPMMPLAMASTCDADSAQPPMEPPKESQPIPRPVRLSDPYFRSVAVVMADVADALDFAHGADVVHRDIKPSNILLDVTGHCWLVDFGLAHVADEAEVKAEEGIARHFAALTCGPMGTPEYMAPEQHMWGDLGEAKSDLRTDVWGLGATLFELLTLDRPFEGRTLKEIRAKVLDGSPPVVNSLVSNLPPDLIAICRTALQKQKQHRYQRAAEFAADLRHWLHGEPTSVRPASVVRAAAMWSRRNKGWATAIAASLLVAILGAISWIVYANAESREAQLRADAAEERIREQQWKGKLQERESLIHSVQRMQLVDLRSGWSETAWKLIGQASEIRKDDRLRDLAIATLQGFDIRHSKRVAVPASSIAFDPSGCRLAVGGIDASTGRAASPSFLWDGERKQDTKLRLTGSVAFRPKSGPIQLASSKDKLEIWDLEREVAVRTIPTGTKGEPAATALSASGDLIAAMWSNPPKIEVWNAGDGSTLASFDAAGEAIAFSADGALLAAEDSKQRAIVVWDVQTCSEVARLPAESLAVRSLAFGRNPHYGQSALMLAAGEAGGSIAVWNLAEKSLVNRYRGSPREVTALAFSPDGVLLCSGGREEARLWDVATGRLLLSFHGPHGMDYVTGIAFRPDGQQFAVSTLGSAYAPSVSVWDLYPERSSRRLLGLAGQIEMVALSPDGKHVAALAQNWEVGVWNLEENRLCGIHVVPPGAYADNGCLGFSPDGKALFFSCASANVTNVRLWDVATGKELRQWQLPPGLQNKMAFDTSGDLWHAQVELKDGEPLPGKKVFPWREFPRLGRIRKLSSDNPAKAVAEIVDFNRYVFRMEMTKDARRLAIEGLGGREGDERWLKVFDLKSGQPEWSYRCPHTVPYANFAFDASGSFLAYSPDDDATRTVLVEVPSGSKCGELFGTPLAISSQADWYAVLIWRNQTGCFVMRKKGGPPVADLALDAALLSVAIDSTGRFVAWGSRQGRLEVCDMHATRRRLEEFGLEW